MTESLLKVCFVLAFPFLSLALRAKEDSHSASGIRASSTALVDKVAVTVSGKGEASLLSALKSLENPDSCRRSDATNCPIQSAALKSPRHAGPASAAAHCPDYKACSCCQVVTDTSSRAASVFDETTEELDQYFRFEKLYNSDGRSSECIATLHLLHCGLMCSSAQSSFAKVQGGQVVVSVCAADCYAMYDACKGATLSYGVVVSTCAV
jgi:hypothetical protein